MFSMVSDWRYLMRGAHSGDMDTDNDDSHCHKAWCWALLTAGAITLRRNQSRDFYTWREKRYSPAYIRQSANQRAGLWFRPMRAQGSQRPKPTGRATSTSGHLRPSHFSQPKHNTLGGQIQNWSVSTLWARQRDFMIGGWNRDIGVVCCI